ncbi:MAG: pyridoxal-phosphate dependent enzyme [Burkholderia sp.]
MRGRPWPPPRWPACDASWCWRAWCRARGIDYARNGNVLLDELFGATIHIAPPGTAALDLAHARAEELRRAGRKVLVIPSGGSTGLGALAYAACAAEIDTQARELGIEFACVACPNGSVGTHAGLVAGFHALGRDPGLVRAYGVLAPADEAAAMTVKLVDEACALLGMAARATASRPRVCWRPCA